MASFTQVPYPQIIAVAIGPAFLFFLSVAFFVRGAAQRQGLSPEADPEAPKLSQVMAEGWPFLLPLVLLVALLMAGFTPVFAAIFAILGCIAASWLSPRKMGPAEVIEALADGARLMAPTALLLVGVGIIVNVIGMTGLGTTFSLMATDWAGGSLLVLIGLVAVASLVLGMGLPVTAAYIVLATLAAPALQDLILQRELIAMLTEGAGTEQLKAVMMLTAPDLAALIGQPMTQTQAMAVIGAVPPDMMPVLRGGLLDAGTVTLALLAAHMIVFWLSQDSNVTPPVALAAFATAGIAGTKPMETGVEAWKIAKGLYIVPLLFAFTPLIGAGPMDVLLICLPAAAALFALGGALDGWLEGRLARAGRLAALAAGLMLLPVWGIWWPVLAGALLLTGLILWQRRARRGLLNPS
jgi:TRAP transporter 4TM/12TM fusion protein